MSLTAYTDPQDARVYIEDFPELFPKDWNGTAQWYKDFKNVLSRELGTVSAAAEAASNITVGSNDELLATLGLTTEDHEWRIANLEEIIDILGGAVGVDVNAVGLTVTGNVITGTQAVAISGGPASKAYFGIQADRLRILSSTGGVTKTPFEVFGAAIRFRCPVIIETGSSGYSNISDKPTTVAEISPGEAAEIAANTLKITNATHTGEVTGANGLTITAGAVTLAKMADMATASFIGRNTAAVGVPEILSATTARSILNVADGATANQSDAFLLSRTNHTGTQAAATISDFETAVDATASVIALLDTAFTRESAGVISTTEEVYFTYSACTIYGETSTILRTDAEFRCNDKIWIGSDCTIYKDAANHLKTDDIFEALRIGVGADPHATYSFLAYSGSTIALQAERAGSATTGIITTAIIKATTLANMVDGFEPGLLFRAEDSSTVENNLGFITAQRYGADNTGKIRIIPYSAGSLSNVAEFWPANTKLTGALEVTGSTKTAGLQMTATSIYRSVNTGQLNLYGGTSGNGANIELYSGSHATQANRAYHDANGHYFRTQSGTSHGSWDASGIWLVSGDSLHINSIQVVGAQQSAISDPASTTAGNNAAIDSILAAMRTHGLIAT